MAQLNPRHDAEIAAFYEAAGDAFRAYWDSLPAVPHTPWTVPANDDFTAANDNVKLEDAA
jgi:hypothetical protein